MKNTNIRRDIAFFHCILNFCKNLRNFHTRIRFFSKLNFVNSNFEFIFHSSSIYMYQYLLLCKIRSINHPKTSITKAIAAIELHIFDKNNQFLIFYTFTSMRRFV